MCIRDRDGQIVLQEGFFLRYHLRLWQVPGSNPPVTLGAVHHEEGLFTHTIDMAWEDAEAFVAGQLCDSGSSCGSTGDLTQQLNIQSLDPDGDPGTWRGWANDGSATVFCGADTDGEGLGDACDPCPGLADCDFDGWTDWQEIAFITTDPENACTPGGYVPDPSPAPDGNGTVGIDDVFFAAGRFNVSDGDPNYTRRAEIASQDGVIGIDDVFGFASRFNQSC